MQVKHPSPPDLTDEEIIAQCDLHAEQIEENDSEEFDRLTDAGLTAQQALEFIAQMRWARDSAERAQREFDRTPATPRSLEARAAAAWHIKILYEQGDRLAALLLRRAQAAASAFLRVAAAATVSALPPRPAARIGARVLASITLTPRILSQRPIAARRARAGVALA